MQVSTPPQERFGAGGGNGPVRMTGGIKPVGEFAKTVELSF